MKFEKFLNNLYVLARCTIIYINRFIKTNVLCGGVESTYKLTSTFILFRFAEFFNLFLLKN